ncbi:MAG: DUF6088 family protein [Planctomycetia bacterium]|nr:DUF6088 family protein [Planctomycetia bacterium]
MDLFQTLTQRYDVNEPIFENSIRIENLSSGNLRLSLSRLVAGKFLARFARGIYYIPVETPFGQSRLNVDRVIERKYIQNAREIFGFYTGLKLANLIGLSQQIPNVVEIITNVEKSRCREVKLGSQRLRLRSPRVPITQDNVEILQFLDLMTRLDPSQFETEQMTALKIFIKNRNIGKDQMSDFIRFFPSKTSKNMIESGIIHELA